MKKWLIFVFAAWLYFILLPQKVNAAEWKMKFVGVSAANTSGMAGASMLMNEDILIDLSCYHKGVCGVHLLESMNINLNEITTVLYTHHHADHFSPSELVKLIDKRSSMAGKLKIYGGVEVVRQLNDYLLSTGKTSAVSIYRLTKHSWVQLGNYRVLPILANHDTAINEPYVYVIEYGGSKMLYGTDSDVIEGESLTILSQQKLQLVIRDVTFKTCRNDDMTKTHLNYCKANVERRNWESRGIINSNTPYYLTHLANWSIPWCDNLCSLERGILATQGLQISLTVVEPTNTPTPIYVGCRLSNGDANGDGRATIQDGHIWYQSFKGIYNINADFNCDNKVDILDGHVWYMAYKGN